MPNPNPTIHECSASTSRPPATSTDGLDGFIVGSGDDSWCKDYGEANHEPPEIKPCGEAGFGFRVE